MCDDHSAHIENVGVPSGIPKIVLTFFAIGLNCYATHAFGDSATDLTSSRLF